MYLWMILIAQLSHRTLTRRSRPPRRCDQSRSWYDRTTFWILNVSVWGQIFTWLTRDTLCTRHATPAPLFHDPRIRRYDLRLHKKGFASLSYEANREYGDMGKRGYLTYSTVSPPSCSPPNPPFQLGWTEGFTVLPGKAPELHKTQASSILRMKCLDMKRYDETSNLYMCSIIQVPIIVQPWRSVGLTPYLIFKNTYM